MPGSGGTLKMRHSILKRRRRSAIAAAEMPRMAVGVHARPVDPNCVVGLKDTQAWSDKAPCQLSCRVHLQAMVAGSAMPSIG
eukprot:5298228-Heterocapsa_arctica.AAC.1